MDELRARLLNMAELVEYQEGSVVSRTIIKNAAGNITIFAFDKGQELSEHTAPFDAFVHIIEGNAEIKINGRSLLAGENSVVIMPANEPHLLKALDRFKMLLAMIKGDNGKK